MPGKSRKTALLKTADVNDDSKRASNETKQEEPIVKSALQSTDVVFGDELGLNDYDIATIDYTQRDADELAELEYKTLLHDEQSFLDNLEIAKALAIEEERKALDSLNEIEPPEDDEEVKRIIKEEAQLVKNIKDYESVQQAEEDRLMTEYHESFDYPVQTSKDSRGVRFFKDLSEFKDKPELKVENTSSLKKGFHTK